MSRGSVDPAPDLDVERRRIRLLTDWFIRHARDLPWRRPEHRSGYGALVAEAMLQQTQVSRVIGRYTRFIRVFPTIHALAAADEQVVLAMWEGLGYYRRAKHLLAAARVVVARFRGEVPSDVAALRELPGVGRYTAGAISSIVFKHAEPLVDGNVDRVLARWSANQDDASDRAAWAWRRASELVRLAPDPGVFNEGLMELGAMVCTPRAPRCGACPVAELCKARRDGLQDRIPAPKQAAARMTWHHHAVIVRRGSRILLEKRPADSMWAGMWQVPTIEADRRLAGPAVEARLRTSLASRLVSLGTFRHDTTHRVIHFHVYEARSRARRGDWRAMDDLAGMPMSNAQRRVLRDFAEITIERSSNQRIRTIMPKRS